MTTTEDQVVGRWVHVHEEDTEDEMVFRPADTELPPARGRMGFELREDGTFAEAGLGATRCSRRGHRQLGARGGHDHAERGCDAGCAREMEVVSADEERLVVRKARELG